MTDTQFQGIFEAYLDAFAATLLAEQERLLRSSVSEDVVYTNPGVEGRGLQNLLKHIRLVQQRFPGHRFRVNWFRQQHGQMLANGLSLGLPSFPSGDSIGIDGPLLEAGASNRSQAAAGIFASTSFRIASGVAFGSPRFKVISFAMNWLRKSPYTSIASALIADFPNSVA